MTNAEPPFRLNEPELRAAIEGRLRDLIVAFEKHGDDKYLRKEAKLFLERIMVLVDQMEGNP